MKKLTICFAIAGFMAGVSSVNAQTIRYSCGANEAWQQAISLDPSLVLRRQQLETEIQQYIKANAANRAIIADTIYTIPVVFHIMEQGGLENIPDSQITNAMQVFNEDYRRVNADTVNTPAAFKPVAADFQIQFRLATKDPNGNCTNGINRVFTDRTNAFNDYAKSIIDWPSDMYLNIWVSKSIGVSSEVGIVIGYAQFPSIAPPGYLGGTSFTDGVVLQNDFVGRAGGTAQGFYAGRDGTHEIGHYLDLIHVWGDAVCGDDQCEDTPTQDSADFGCPTYPHITCGNNGDMSDNYMDYSDGDCKDIFTLDQRARAWATLNIARYSLWQQSNLVATGTDDASYYSPLQCAPTADFLVNHSMDNTYSNRISICSGASAYFKDNSTHGTPTSWLWSFQGGTPSSSTLQDPTGIVYGTPGTYPVTLTATNEQGSSVSSRPVVVIVRPTTGAVAAPYTEGFDESSFPPNGWMKFNDDGGPGWQQTSRASYSGGFSASIQNYETIATTAPGSIKELVTPGFDLTNVASPVLSFYLAYGLQYSGNMDSLSIGISSDCAQAWTELMRFGNGTNATSLSAGSGGFQPNNFAPNSPDEWQLVTIPLDAYAGQNNVFFHFYFKTDLLSNNLYIDDFNITGTVGINEFANPNFSFDVVPNPASGWFNINYELKQHEDLTISLYDLQGRLVKQIESISATPGTYQSRVEASSFNLASGVYMVRMMTPDGVISRKLVYTGE